MRLSELIDKHFGGSKKLASEHCNANYQSVRQAVSARDPEVLKISDGRYVVNTKHVIIFEVKK